MPKRREPMTSDSVDTKSPMRDDEENPWFGWPPGEKAMVKYGHASEEGTPAAMIHQLQLDVDDARADVHRLQEDLEETQSQLTELELQNAEYRNVIRRIHGNVGELFWHMRQLYGKEHAPDEMVKHAGLTIANRDVFKALILDRILEVERMVRDNT